MASGGAVKRYETDKGILKLNDRDAVRLGFKDPEPEDGEAPSSPRRRSTSKKRPAPAPAVPADAE